MRSRSSDAGNGPPSEPLAPDPLSEVLQDLRLTGVSYGRCELTRPWGIEFPPQQAARFHFVAEGECWLHEPSAGWIPLAAGDVALLPHGAGHQMAHAARGRTRPLDAIPLEEIGERTYRLREGGSGPRSLLFCCSASFAAPAIHPLIELMPPLLLVRGAASDDPSLPALLDTMAAEVLAQRVGAATVLTRLADVIITRVIRAWVEARSLDAAGWPSGLSKGWPKGWLGAIRDPQIGRALAAIHRRPGHRWSVEALADEARISRSMFAARFVAAVGVSPARYLARWRMHLATVWLRNERRTVAAVAARLGYASEAAFSRAFKRLHGIPPSAVRRAEPSAGLPAVSEHVLTVE